MEIKLTFREKLKLSSKLILSFLYSITPGAMVVIEGEGETYTVHKNLFVTISDGDSKDMLPLIFCSQEFVDKVGKIMSEKWITKATKLTDREDEYMNSR